jgi:hypothetical protein
MMILIITVASTILIITLAISSDYEILIMGLISVDLLAIAMIILALYMMKKVIDREDNQSVDV